MRGVSFQGWLSKVFLNIRHSHRHKGLSNAVCFHAENNTFAQKETYWIKLQKNLIILIEFDIVNCHLLAPRITNGCWSFFWQHDIMCAGFVPA